MLLKLALSAAVSVFLYDQGAGPEAGKAGISNAISPLKQASKSKTPQVELKKLEQQIVERTNAQRVKYGLPPLVVDRNLQQTARTHAAWMTNNHTLQHTTKPVGENIAMGQHNSAEAVGDWMASSGHRANILNGTYKRIGAAAYTASDGTVFWCQQFLP